MTTNFNKRFERINPFCRSEENLSSLLCKIDAHKKSDQGLIISLTSCYKYQWKVVFSEEQTLSSPHSPASVGSKTEKAMVVCR